MIQRISKGRSFGGCVRYVCNKPGAEIIGGAYEREATAAEISADLARHGHAGELTQKPVFHVALSLPPGEVLSDAKWNFVAREYLKAQGLTDSPYLIVRHTDTGCDHIHVIASRVDYSGKLISDSNDRPKGMAAMQKLERELHLQSARQRAGERGLSQREYRGAERTGGPNVRREVQSILREAVKGSPNLDSFLGRLNRAGVEVRFNSTTSGNVRGISFEFRGITFSGSSLGRDFSWSGLQRTGVEYQGVRDARLVKSRPRAAASTSWPQSGLSDLAQRLGQLRTSAGRTSLAGARAALLGRGSSALGSAASAVRLLRDVRHPGRAFLRRLPGGLAVSTGLAFFGAFTSPVSAAALAVSLIGRGLGAAGRAKPRDSDARAVLLQFVTAAAADRPTAATFASRLAECGISVETSPGGALVYRVGDVHLKDPNIGRAFTEGRARLGDPVDGRPIAIAPRRPGIADPPGVEGPAQGATAARRVGDSASRARGHSESSHHTWPGPGAAQGAPHGGGEPPRLAQEHQPAASATGGDRDRSARLAFDSRDGLRDHRQPSRLDLAREGAPPARGGSFDPGSVSTAALPRPEAARGASRAAEPIAGAVERHLAALSSPAFDIRIGTGAQARILPALSAPQIVMQVPELAAANAKGLPIAIRAANRAGASFVGFTDAAGAERARASGFEPAAVIDAGGRLAVWVQHAPAAEAVRPYLQRATLLAYGQNPETAGRAFGPLAGFRDSEAAAQIAQASGAAYTRSAPLAAELTTARAERLAELGARLRAAGVPNLATFSSVAKNPRAADLEWARLALSRGLAQGDVVAILATQGRHRASAPTTQLRHASNTLAAALGSSRETAHVLRIVASAAAIPLRILQIAAAVLRFGASLAR